MQMAVLPPLPPRSGTTGAIGFDQIGVNSIVLDPAVLEMFFFKNDVGAYLIIIFIGSADVDDTGNADLILS